MPPLQVRRWTAQEFLANRAAWQRLLASSDADPLFMSWDWLTTWWRHHAALLRADLCVLAVYSADDELCAIAPLYTHRAVHRGLFAVRRYELLGNAWRNSVAIFSEYLDVIAQRERRGVACAALRDWLIAGEEWDELVLCNVRADSVAARLGTELGNHYHLRAVEPMHGWSVALPESFEAFTAQLSSNTRRKVFNQREKLVAASCETTQPAQRTAALERLEAFVARRWGAPAGAGNLRARFHADLVQRGADDGVARLTELRAGGHCISVMLNLRVDGAEYYLQSGFDEDQASGISPGYLHLGYAIEAACRAGIRRFDFLAGRGLNRDYKQDFAAVSTPLICLHIVKQPMLRALFRAFDRLGGHTSHTAWLEG